MMSTTDLSPFPIAINGLCKEFRNKKLQTIHALKGITLTISQGEVFGFLGPNGAGKSTTIKSLMSLIRPTKGQVKLFGQRSDAESARMKVGYLPENPSFYSFLNAHEYLHFVGKAFRMSTSAIAVKSEEVLSALSLDHASKRPIRGYSKGMVQRLGLAQALLHDPDLYILDEPMSGLDPLGRALVKDIILNLKAKGKTVFFSTHVTADIERVCDRVGVLVDGALLEERNVADLLQEGVDGYHCRVRLSLGALVGEWQLHECGRGVYEGVVPRIEFDRFAATILSSGGSFDLIEPKRRDIEDFFLTLVTRSEG